MTASAHGAIYNSRPLVPEVLVKGNDWAVVRPRVGVEAMIAGDRLPPWQMTVTDR